MKIVKTVLVAIGASLLAATAASAHVTLNPRAAPADSFSRFALRVPTEEDVPTVRLSVQLPEGVEEVGFQPKPGWTRTQSGRVVTWSGGQIGVGEFDEFGLSIHVPNTPGETLVFPATQTYANGKVVRWIGTPESDFPAPRLTIEAPEGEEPTTSTTAAAAQTDEGEDRDALTLGLSIAGVLLALLALGLGLFRRRPA